MGAVEFQNLVSGKDAQTAFWRASQDAAYEYGHDPYSGTIAVKHDHRIVTPGVLSYEDAKALANAFNEATWYEHEPEPGRFTDFVKRSHWNPYADKWGAAGCIEVDPSSLSDGQRQWMGVQDGERVFYFFGLASY